MFILPKSRMALRSEWFGVTSRCSSYKFVLGLVPDWRSQRAMAARSYEWPSAAITGSFMRSCVIGQEKLGGTTSGARGAAWAFSTWPFHIHCRTARCPIIAATLQ